MDEAATLRGIAQGLEQWYVLLGRQFGPLSRPQRRVLTAIAASDELRVGDLTEQLGVTTAGATRMVDTLEALGYVRRFRLPDADQRQVCLALTEEGRTAMAEADGVFLERVRATIGRLSEAERGQLARLLEAIGPQ